jgi:acyl-CoA synthetase (AMP-forming)/AMP-acid ligase II
LLNLAAIHEAIAEVVPDRECLVSGTRRFSWAETTDRTRRLASLLRRHGLGCHTQRGGLEGWESGQDHVALYLYNGHEYLEGMLGAFKARCAPFNVNYRYVEEELRYLFDNSKAKAVVYHATFAPMLEKIRDQLSQVDLWIQVADESGNALLPGAVDYEEALSKEPPEPPQALSPDDLYILYTGGTTGMPKGVLWRQEDIFLAALSSGGTPKTIEGLQERARTRPGPRALPAPPFMHGAAHWVAFNMWHVAGTVVVQSQTRRMDPDDIWSTIEREGVSALTIVGDAFAVPLLDQLNEKSYDLTQLRQIGTGGAILTALRKRELLERIPHVKILDALGSSETGSQGSQLTRPDEAASAATGRFAMAADNEVLSEDLSHALAPGSGEAGWLAKRGRVPLGYYRDPEKSALTFPTVNGVRYSVPGDRCVLEADGSLTLLGRDSVTINSGGEKIYAEEVEQALKHHPSVYDTVVVGTPSERWGQQVTAIVQLREGAELDEDDMKRVASEHVTGYKLPKAFVYVSTITRAPSGKADYRWAKRTALGALGLPPPE